MSTICKNCSHQYEGLYCNQCGQSSDTHPLTMHFIWHEVQHGLFHVDRGIFYTIGQLLTRPGAMVRDFIDGKRVRYFKPVTLVVVLATLYGVLFHFLIDDMVVVEPGKSSDNVVGAYQTVIQWITAHLAYASLLLIVTTTLASFVVFRSQGYNFVEYLVLNTFYRGLVQVVHLLLLPVLYMSIRSETLSNYAFFTQLLDFLLMYWCYAQFFHKIPKGKALFLTILSYLLMSVINVGVGYGAGYLVKLFSH